MEKNSLELFNYCKKYFYFYKKAYHCLSSTGTYIRNMSKAYTREYSIHYLHEWEVKELYAHNINQYWKCMEIIDYLRGNPPHPKLKSYLEKYPNLSIEWYITTNKRYL